MRTFALRSIFLLLTVCLFSSLALAQRGSLGIHAGYMNPKDTKSTFMVGGMWGTAIDEAVDVGIGFDIIHKSYTERTKVADASGPADINYGTYYDELTYSRTILPLMLEIDMKIPTSRYLGYLIRGGLGYSWLWSKEKNYNEKTDETRNFSGFGWLASAGVYYHIGSRSTFTVDLFYLNNTVSRDAKETKQGLPVSERVDLSGLGARVGVLLDLR
jgi:hypothetical protein